MLDNFSYFLEITFTSQSEEKIFLFSDTFTHDGCKKGTAEISFCTSPYKAFDLAAKEKEKKKLEEKQQS